MANGATFDGLDGVTVLPYGAVIEDDRRRFEAHIDSNSLWLCCNGSIH